MTKQTSEVIIDGTNDIVTSAVDTAMQKKKKAKKQAGFTLLEIVVATGLMGVLVAMTLPNILGSRDQAQNNAAQSNVTQGAIAHYVSEGTPFDALCWDGTGEAFTTGATAADNNVTVAAGAACTEAELGGVDGKGAQIYPKLEAAAK